MSYYLYSLEIKNRIILLVVAWLFTLLICYLYKDVLLFFLLNSTHFFQSPLENLAESHYFIFTDVTEIFYVYINLILFISNQVILFNFFYHFLMFLSPSLRKSEYSNLYFFIKISLFVYLFSIILFNVFLFPLSWNFFLNFQLNGFNWIPLFFEAKISEYLIYYINLYSICILNSQFGVFLLVYINSLSKNVLEIKKLRKIFYFLFFFVSTLVTPPDVISQLCFSVVLIFVYETIIILKFTDGFALKF